MKRTSSVEVKPMIKSSSDWIAALHCDKFQLDNSANDVSERERDRMSNLALINRKEGKREMNQSKQFQNNFQSKPLHSS